MMPMRHRGEIYLVEWSNPYTSPPDGQDRVLAWGASRTDGKDDEMRKAVAAYAGPFGNGYGVKVLVNVMPGYQPMPPEQLLKRRLTKLWRRCKKKWPLMPRERYREAIERHPERYSLEEIRKRQEEKMRLLDMDELECGLDPDKQVVLNEEEAADVP